jgi:hypothetical protein
MNNIVLLGNGFDLAHGLETRYTDFVFWYLKKALPEPMKSGANYEDDLVSINFDGRHFKESNYDSIKEILRTLRANEVTIYWKDRFFEKIVKAARDFNWVDIEYEYYSSLIDLYKELEKHNVDSYPKIDNDVVRLNNCFTSIQKKLIEYLTIINEVKPVKNSVIEQHFKDIVRSNTFDKEKDGLLIVNFNYTSTIELYLARCNFCKIINIHGKLNCENNLIIFGYGDEMDIFYEKLERLNNNDFLKKFKSFSYFNTSNYQEISRFFKHEDYRVTIMGHSCGLSDRVLLNSIFDNSLCKEIKIFYHQKENSSNDYFQKTQEISRHFRPISKGTMRNIITPFHECVRLS